MTHHVRTVVIPMAGEGRRMLPVSRGAPKELMPVGGTPLIVHALLEAAASGFEEILIVLSPEKERLLPWIRSEAPEGVRVVAVLQPRPLGLADAQDRCRDRLGGEPFAVLLPDTLFAGREPGLLQVKEAFESTGRDTLGLIRVRPGEVFSDCGAVEIEPQAGEPFPLLRSVGSKRPGLLHVPAGETRLRAFPRSVFLPHYFDFVDGVREDLRPGEELDDVPVLQRMVEEVGVTGLALKGRGWDAGTPEGLARAREDFGG
ncbi:MAG: sugar phosphate nucleotidyltransferase [Nitrospinota bacterium]